MQERSESLVDWLRIHSRTVSIAAVALVAVGAGTWLYRESKQSEAQRAEMALARGEQSYASGNVPLAQTDLERVVSQYGGTPAGVQAAVILAQIYYEQRQFQKGIDALRQVDEGSAGAQRVVLETLIANGYEELAKYDTAATHYMRAAEATPFETDQANLKANAARAYASAGQADKAKAIWEELAKDPSGPVAQEAAVRLGELVAKPAGRS
jgi:tetratricopeptide (TPR) repeat protein